MLKTGLVYCKIKHAVQTFFKWGQFRSHQNTRGPGTKISFNFSVITAAGYHLIAVVTHKMTFKNRVNC